MVNSSTNGVHIKVEDDTDEMEIMDLQIAESRRGLEDQRFIEPCHTTVHTEPRPEPYDKLRFLYTKRVFHTPPEVMGMTIQSGRKVLERMRDHPMKTFIMSIEAGFLLSFGVLMSFQVGGRWGSSTGVNNFVFGGFGIPFGLTFIVFMQGSELMTANYMYTTLAWLASRKTEWKWEFKALLANWIVCWLGNFTGAVLHFILFAWQSGLIKTIKIKGDNGLPGRSYSDTLDNLEHADVIYYDSIDDFRSDFDDGDLCFRDNYANGNLCKLIQLGYKKSIANFGTTILRGWGCNWMVCLAMWLQSTATEPISKLFMIWLPVTLFVACGFDHFVVNTWLLPGSILVGGTYYDRRLNWGNAFFYNLLPATIGAILGAWCLVFHIWYLYRDSWRIAQEKRATYRPATCHGAIIPQPPSENNYTASLRRPKGVPRDFDPRPVESDDDEEPDQVSIRRQSQSTSEE
mmetsp:Transcript_14679/g.22120  ORF Transcript_14679/g.22120 Transcript_14679/m.22120 type:complete len:459 (-) Transcript_14679:307-1683(-)